MGLTGIAMGAWIGSLFGGPLGALLGAVAGNSIEKKIKAPAQKRAMVFSASAAAILAKMAKADGLVTPDEIASVEAAFNRLGFDQTTRDYAVNVFRRAKDDHHSIYEYATEFAGAVDSVQVRELFYELLWDLACADGVVSSYELTILKRIPNSLKIRSEWFDIHYRERMTSSRRDSYHSVDPLAEAYRTLGVESNASDDAVKKAYRDLAKQNHPDILRAKGLPEELIGKATEKMSRINEAWSKVKEARGL